MGPAGFVLTTAAVVGFLLSVWFWDASHLSAGPNINVAYSSYLPDKCTILVDRAGEPRKSAQVYFWGGNVRMDLKIVDLNNTVTQAHAIITPGGSTYRWRDDVKDGDILREKQDYTLIENIAPSNSWFCYPWIGLNFSKFTPPKDVNFNDLNNF